MSDTKRRQYFMEHEQMDFETQILLGGCYYGAADIGEILATVERIPSGDFEKWYQEWFTIAERVQGIAEQSASSGNPVSARRYKRPVERRTCLETTPDLLGAVLFLHESTGREGEYPVRKYLNARVLFPSRQSRQPMGYDYL
jgi:hypothetical protein